MLPSTLPEFPQFKSFPAEIHSLIMESCKPNDLICLRLTCKYLYNLSPDQSILPLSNNDSDPLCIHDPSDLTWKDTSSWSARYTHSIHCHALSHAETLKLHPTISQTPGRCRTRYLASQGHCQCYLQRTKLHRRLRSWVPSKLKYCSTCDMFTKRKRGHKGRCYHGLPKPRVYEGNYWTHRPRRGAFGRKLWKKWFNNAAMNKFEGRLRKGIAGRESNKRYELRRLEGREVDSSAARDTEPSRWVPRYPLDSTWDTPTSSSATYTSGGLLS
ncbi:hypothetical protein BGZ60DRAFT_414798 [Tricladium varicosporioides]|nr:hypothetical protein BGZ60DRAFT_414798 [Hymenoscyphus varicosporioides]